MKRYFTNQLNYKLSNSIKYNQQKYNRDNKCISTRKIKISTMEEHQCSYKMVRRYQQQR